MIRLALHDEAVNPRVSPLLRSCPGPMTRAPRRETTVVYSLEGSQGYTRSLGDVWKGLDPWILFAKALCVRRGSSLHFGVRLEGFIVLLQHLLVSRLDIPKGRKSPEVLEGCIHLSVF